MRTFRGVLWAVLLVGALLLSGCTGEEDPGPMESSSSASSTSAPSETTTAEATPTPTVPPMPEAATVADAAGAEAFVSHWIDLLNYAYATGDIEPVRSISEAGCESCAQTFSVIRGRASEDKRLEAGLIDLISVRSPPPEDAGVVSVSVRFEQEAGVEISADGVKREVEGTEPSNAGFVLAYVDEAWAMAGVGDE